MTTMYMYMYVHYSTLTMLLHTAYVLCAKLVELKNGETYNGHLVNCDTWMNIHLREVICTSRVSLITLCYI